MKLGAGTVIFPLAKIARPALFTAGRHTRVDDFTLITAQTALGHFVHIGSHCALLGDAGADITVDDFAGVSPGARLFCATDDFTGQGLTGPTVPPCFRAPVLSAPIKLGKHVIVGANSVVMPGVVAHEGAIVGAGSFVPAGAVLQPWTVYVGCPVRAVRVRDAAPVLKARHALLASTPEFCIEGTA